MAKPRRRLGCGGAILLFLLVGVCMSILGGNKGDGTARTQGTTPAPAQQSQPLPLARMLAELVNDPASHPIVEQSTEGDRQYHTWNLPAWGEQVGGVQRSGTDWWVKISGRKIGVDDIAPASQRDELGGNGVATSYRVVSGPLAGVVLTESASTLHVFSEEWYTRTMQ